MEKYEVVQMAVVLFEDADFITQSTCPPDCQYELPMS